MIYEILLLRFLHVLGGIFWLGGGLFMSVFLVPALAKSGMNAGPVFAALQQRRLFAVLPAVAVLVILSGLRLLSIASGDSSSYLRSTSGRTFAVSGALAVIAFLMSLIVARPANVRLASLGAAVAAAAGHERAALVGQVAVLQRRIAVSSMVATACLVLCGVGMSVARYLP
ncbi:MAG: putative rane protein [Gemmatimonadetes bacterium]|nr:putative rane protein [Gemmatimonadota bacterium]